MGFKQTEVLRIITGAITFKRYSKFYSRVSQLWEISKFLNSHVQIQKSLGICIQNGFSSLGLLCKEIHHEMIEKQAIHTKGLPTNVSNGALYSVIDSSVTR